MSQRTFSVGDAESTRSAADSRATLSQKVSRLLKRTPPIVKGEWIVMCEFAVVIALVVIVWGLLSLPIVFFYTTDSDTATGAAPPLIARFVGKHVYSRKRFGLIGAQNAYKRQMRDYHAIIIPNLRISPSTFSNRRFSS